MIENEVIHWSDNPILNVSNFMAEPNPGIFEDSHSVIKYRFTWTVNSDKINGEIVFLIENIQIFTNLQMNIQIIFGCPKI